MSKNVTPEHIAYVRRRLSAIADHVGAWRAIASNRDRKATMLWEATGNSPEEEEAVLLACDAWERVYRWENEYATHRNHLDALEAS